MRVGFQVKQGCAIIWHSPVLFKKCVFVFSDQRQTARQLSLPEDGHR